MICAGEILDSLSDICAGEIFDLSKVFATENERFDLMHDICGGGGEMFDSLKMIFELGGRRK